MITGLERKINIVTLGKGKERVEQAGSSLVAEVLLKTEGEKRIEVGI